MGARIVGCGKALPGLEVKNESLERLVETSDEWIVSRTGISSRRISIKETTLDLAVLASLKAMGCEIPESDKIASIESSGKAIVPCLPSDIDLIIVSTITPDTIVPCTASALKRRLNAESAVAFDVNAACSGFVYAISIAESMMAASISKPKYGANSQPIRRALVVSSERLSRLTDWQDRNTCVLFGDGAGAAVLEWTDSDEGVMSVFLQNQDDEGNSLTCLQSYDSIIPFTEEGVVFDDEKLEAHRLGHPDPKTVDYSYINGLDICEDPSKAATFEKFEIVRKMEFGGPEQSVFMNGQKVFKFASKAMERCVRKAAELAGIEVEDIDLIVPHQANYRIIEFASKRLGIPLDKFQISIDHTGNTSSSCLPMALSDAISEERISKGSIICLVAFGGGLTSGATIVRF